MTEEQKAPFFACYVNCGFCANFGAAVEESASTILTDELAATKDNWSGSVKTKWGTISGSSKLADTKDNWSGSIKTKWGTISGSSKLADNSLTCDSEGNCMLRDSLALC